MFSLARIFLVYSILTCATLTKLIIEMKRTVSMFFWVYSILTCSFRIQATTDTHSESSQILSNSRTDLTD